MSPTCCANFQKATALRWRGCLHLGRIVPLAWQVVEVPFLVGCLLLLLLNQHEPNIANKRQSDLILGCPFLVVELAYPILVCCNSVQRSQLRATCLACNRWNNCPTDGYPLAYPPPEWLGAGHTWKTTGGKQLGDLDESLGQAAHPEHPAHPSQTFPWRGLTFQKLAGTGSPVQTSTCPFSPFRSSRCASFKQPNSNLVNWLVTGQTWFRTRPARLPPSVFLSTPAAQVF